MPEEGAHVLELDSEPNLLRQENPGTTVRLCLKIKSESKVGKVRSAYRQL